MELLPSRTSEIRTAREVFSKRFEESESLLRDAVEAFFWAFDVSVLE